MFVAFERAVPWHIKLHGSVDWARPVTGVNRPLVRWLYSVLERLAGIRCPATSVVWSPRSGGSAGSHGPVRPEPVIGQPPTWFCQLFPCSTQKQ